jgi:hypothetical protein
MLSLVLVSLSLSACSDTTAPSPTTKRQIGAAEASTLTTCKGGSLESSGKC